MTSLEPNESTITHSCWRETRVSLQRARVMLKLNQSNFPAQSRTFPQPFAHESYMISSRRTLRRSRWAPSPHEQKHTALHRGLNWQWGSGSGVTQSAEGLEKTSAPRDMLRNPPVKIATVMASLSSHRLLSVPFKTARNAGPEWTKRIFVVSEFQLGAHAA